MSLFRTQIYLSEVSSLHRFTFYSSTMTVQLNTKSLDKLEAESSESIHYVPCRIQADCRANVLQYFSRFIEEKDDQTREVSFRGRPFSGKVINLPDSYRGVVFLETLKPKSLKAERKFHAVRSFRSFTYWNWDKLPSKNDPLMCALDWMDISKAVHSSIEEPISSDQSSVENCKESKEVNCNGTRTGEEGMNGHTKEYSEDPMETESVENYMNKDNTDNTADDQKS